MGCDIHAYIEYKDPKYDWWDSFATGINPGRNYTMFGLMAKGVRSDYNDGFIPKGLPENLAYVTESDNRLYITNNRDGSRTCTLDDAEKFKEYGCKVINNKEGKPTWVTHPDWHTHSWLTIDEFEKALNTYYKKAEIEGYSGKLIEYESILAVMKRLKELDCETRLVFWFDN
jgi:hypothetical protein